ncbi:MAG: DUF2357 domain-containing protein [Desulfuromonadales bacterium]
MDSLPTSNIRFLDWEGKQVASPAEWSTSFVEVCLPLEDIDSVALFLQGREMNVIRSRQFGTAMLLANWERSNPGSYRLRLVHGGTVYEEKVTIRPQKISFDSFGTMLEDLECRLPATIALSLQQCGGLVGIKTQPPGESTLAQQILRLQRAVHGTDRRTGLLRIITELTDRYHQILTTSEIWVKREKVRRPSAARLMQSLTRSGNLDEKGVPQHIIDTRVEHTADVYENRLLNTFIRQVERRLSALQRALSGKNNAQGIKLSEMQAALKKARRAAAFLDDVSELSLSPDCLTMVLLKRPPYRAALEGYLEFHKNASVRLDEALLDAPLDNLPRLYQFWGTLIVLQALLEVGSGSGYFIDHESLFHRDSGGLFVKLLPDGKDVIRLKHPHTGTVVKLTPERSFLRNRGLGSVSYEQRPDIVIELIRADNVREVYIFDPKYKLASEEQSNGDGKPQKTDIDKMHAYRDAIRDESGKRVVKYAAILYPGQSELFDHGLAALRAYPGEEDELLLAIKERLKPVLDEAGRLS